MSEHELDSSKAMVVHQDIMAHIVDSPDDVGNGNGYCGPKEREWFIDGWDDEKLYDRQQQEEMLLAAYQRRIGTSNNKPKQNEIVLLNGPSGCGKTALARCFRKQVESLTPPAIFISGKFDQLRQHSVPYAPIVAAFEQFTDHVLAQGAEMTQNMKEIIEVVVGSELSTLLQLLPCLKRILGLPRSSSVSSLSTLSSNGIQQTTSIMPVGTSGNHNRLVVVLRRLIRAICSCGGSERKPLVLFLDDLQFADQISLDLISALVSPSIDNLQGLMVIGSCRGDEIDPFDPLSKLLRELEEKGTLITEVLVPALQVESIAPMIHEMTDEELPFEQCLALAEQIHSQTNGNPFFVKQYLRNLEENSILYEDVNDGVWVFKESATLDLNPANFDDDGLDQLVERMRKFPMDVQEVVKAAACLGGEIQETLLYQALGGNLSTYQIRNALQIAAGHGLIEFNFEDRVGHFLHDKFQEAAIMLIDSGEKACFYLRLGRNLQDAQGSSKDFKKMISIVVNLILYGKDEIESQAEKEKLALLCLQVGRHMAKSSAFSKAMEYLEEGINLLPSDHWENQYALSLALFNAAAEIAYCVGEHSKVDRFADEIIHNAGTFEHKLNVYTTMILSLGSRGLSGRAGAVGVHVLVRLGEPRPKRVRKIDVLLSLSKIQRMLRGKTDEDILNLPQISDAKVIGIMSILHVLYPILLVSHIEYTTLISFRLISLTLHYGLCSYASVGFAFYGSVLARMGRFSEGYKYGELSLRIVERYPTKELLARSLLRVGLNLRIFKEPYRVSLETVTEAHRLGLSTGDIETSMWASNASCAIRTCTGEPLDSIVKDLRSYMELCEDYGQPAIGLFFRPMLQFCLNMMGFAAGNPLVLTGEAMNEKKMLEQARAEHKTGLTTSILHFKCRLAMHFNELMYAESLFSELSRSTKMNLPTSPIFSVLHKFYQAIVAIEHAKKFKRPSFARYRQLKTARLKLQKLEEAANHCPENMMNKVLLIQAELLACDGRYEESLSKFRQSIVFAEHEGFLHEHALACEKTARMLRDCFENASEAESYFVKARDLYQRYGATILMDRMSKEIGSCHKHSADVGVTKQGRTNGRVSYIPRFSEEDFAILGCY